MFAIVRFVGEVDAAAAGLTSLARVITLIGEVVNSALSIYSNVDNPTRAPVAVFEMLLGAATM